MAEPTEVKNAFSSPFVLDNAKLARILNIMEQRFKGVALPFVPKYQITLLNGKNINLSDVEGLLALDNTVKNPISRLSINAEEAIADTTLSCEVEFESSHRRNVSLRVTSGDNKVASQLFAELEEQVERTFIRSPVYKYFMPDSIIWMFLLSFLAAIGFAGVLFALPPSDRMTPPRLPAEEIQQLIDKSRQATDLNSKVDFLFEAQTKQLASMAAPQKPILKLPSLVNVQNFFLLLPLLIILGCVIYLVRHCYPYAVFLWGDYEEHYKTLMGRKKTLWTTVILSLILGVVGRLFISGLSNYVKIN